MGQKDEMRSPFSVQETWNYQLEFAGIRGPEFMVPSIDFYEYVENKFGFA